MKAGIDYSMTGPAMSVIKDGVHFAYTLCGRKKLTGHYTSEDFSVKIDFLPKFDNNEERFNFIKDYFENILNIYHPEATEIVLEGYSYGSRAGVTFEIGENTGVLKNMLHHKGRTLRIVAPTELKKFATGKGNSKKDAMAEAYPFNEDLHALVGTKVGTSPTSDIIDSYFLSKF